MQVLFATLLDIGPTRLVRRLRYTLRQLLESFLPPSVSFLLIGLSRHSSCPTWRPVLPQLLETEHPLPYPPIPSKPLRFTFLNQERSLPWPIEWNNPNWERLWQFNLHYFDWARVWLEQSLTSHSWPKHAYALNLLIDHWIATNLPGRGDGWHSYTTSLRIRNWTWIFRCYPSLATPKRVHSLWTQLLWLQAHPEHCHGGNHWLENLIALAIVSLQFDGDSARRIHIHSIRLLRVELTSQVLSDGGHEERSVSYHILILDRLVELACCLASVTGQRPFWLVQSISLMTEWLRSVCFEGGLVPLFNDSAPDSAPPPSAVLSFADAFLSSSSALISHRLPPCSLRQRLLLAAFSKTFTAPSPFPPPFLKSPPHHRLALYRLDFIAARFWMGIVISLWYCMSRPSSIPCPF